MPNSIDLKEAERKVFTSYFQDGLWDIGLGGFFLMFAIAPLLSEGLGDFWSSAVFLPFFGLLCAILWAIRRRTVRPRIGEVKFGQWRKGQMLRFTLIMLIFMCFALALGVLSLVHIETLPGWAHSARFSLITFLSFILAAYFLNFSRLYLYGILVAAAPLIGEWMWENLNVSHHGFPITFGAVSGVMILTGIIHLLRLIQDHPLLPTSANVER